MPVEHFLREAVAILGAAVVVVLLAAPLRIRPIVGFLVTGLAIGPSGLGWVKDIERVEVFAEIGVVLLLFAIGLELDLGELRQLGRPFFVAGSVQCLLTAAAAMAIAMVVFGEPAREALFVGLVVCLSSTAVALKLFEERRELGTPQGKVSLGVLLFQDLLIVPIIVLVPVLAGAVAASAGSLAVRFGGALAAIGGVAFLARYAMPRLLRRVVALRSREVFVLGALVLCLAMAWFTHSLGFSLALGAFLAGLIVSESEYSHQIVADIAPFRDLFSSIFFVSVGMLVDLRFAAGHLPAIAGTALAILVIKGVTVAAAVRLAGYPQRIAIVAGLALAQIGEFSFLLMEVGRSYGLLEGVRFQLLLSASVLTLATTPALFAVAPWISGRFAGSTPQAPVAAAPKEAQRTGHVVVVGYGMNGGLLVKVMREARIPFVVVELDPVTVREAREQGIPILYGDATRPEIQQHAGVERARVVMFAISDPHATRLAVALARSLNPALHIIVRTRMVKEIEQLRATGANLVIAEEFEAAIEIFTHVLEIYHVPRNIVRAQTRVLRGEGYRMLRAERQGKGVSQAVLDALEAGTTDLFRVTSEGGLVGRTLREIDLQSAAGAAVIAVVRGEQSFVNPSADQQLEAGDYLVLVGSHDQIERSFVFLDDVGGVATG